MKIGDRNLQVRWLTGGPDSDPFRDRRRGYLPGQLWTFADIDDIWLAEIVVVVGQVAGSGSRGRVLHHSYHYYHW